MFEWDRNLLVPIFVWNISYMCEGAKAYLYSLPFHEKFAAILPFSFHTRPMTGSPERGWTLITRWKNNETVTHFRLFNWKLEIFTTLFLQVFSYRKLMIFMVFFFFFFFIFATLPIDCCQYGWSLCSPCMYQRATYCLEFSPGRVSRSLSMAWMSGTSLGKGSPARKSIHWFRVTLGAVRGLFRQVAQPPAWIIIIIITIQSFSSSWTFRMKPVILAWIFLMRKTMVDFLLKVMKMIFNRDWGV